MRFYENSKVTSENRKKPRCYYIPGGISEYLLLNGIWRFNFYKRDVDVPEHIKKWGTIKVPSCWQTEGYENPNYSNIHYPIPVDPPYVPDENPCGIYERDFVLEKILGKVYFVFEGVATCGVLYINGNYVGFTQGSHLQAEFDITEFIKKGKNTVRVKVLKWCAGSYLEDQDSFRMNGIFRDCYILNRPSGHINDVTVRAENSVITVTPDKKADISLYDVDGKLIGKADSVTTAGFSVKNPKYWNAEKPVLYTVLISRNGEEIKFRTAFRSIAISKKYELLINGTPIKLYGVNHHDTNPYNGWYESDDDLMLDLKQMKKLNINCIRTSHYPPTPKFLDMCDEMGFYVILENDIETHGFVSRDPNATGGYDVSNRVWPCQHPMWRKEYLERMKRAVARDKNHVSVIMWSAGNESGYGKNHELMIDWLRSLDDGRLAHYEGAGDKGVISGSDVYSRMYLSPLELVKKVKDRKINRPVFLCEFSHAMGNGPGDVYQYADVFNAYPKAIGGCIWEWADHTVLDKNGVGRYGGDFEGELTSDSNFCCDGLVFYDRSFKSGSYEAKAAYQPMRTEYSDGVITVNNLYSFTDLSERKFKYTVTLDGEIKTEKAVKLNIPPLSSGTVNIPVKLYKCKYGAFLNCYLYDGDNEIAHTQHELPAQLLTEKPAKVMPVITEDKEFYTVTGNGFEYKFSKLYGAITQATVGGKKQLSEKMRLTAYRAPIDNDRRIRNNWVQGEAWKSENLNRQFSKVYDIGISANKITVRGALSGVSRFAFANYTLNASFYGDGMVDFDIDVKIRKSAFWLPRFGFEFSVPDKNAKFEYFGNGPYESYIDMNHGGLTGLYRSTAQREYVNYIRPQEHGNHTNVRMLKIGDLIFTGKNLDIGVSQYNTEILDKAEHTDELYKTGKTYVRVDYKMSGVGSDSCGPKLPPQYSLSEKKFKIKFSMAPIK
ncbi:MAG: glycoside hydrolase family 2 [Clostridia bacterium]|nr:glycoside hydrolase family 2 [Clostridia bacterium]